MDRGVWWAKVPGVTQESGTTLGTKQQHGWFTVLCYFQVQQSGSVTAKWISYTYESTINFQILSHMGYRRPLSRVPCAVQ